MSPFGDDYPPDNDPDLEQQLDYFQSHATDLQRQLAEANEKLKAYGEVHTNVVPGLDGDGEEVPATPESIKAFLQELQGEWDTSERECMALTQRNAELQAEVEAVKADNAALLECLTEELPYAIKRAERLREQLGFGEMVYLKIHDYCTKPHPGAVLLAELQRLREAAARMEWQGISEAFHTDDFRLYGLHVRNNSTQNHWWEVYYLQINEDGQLEDINGDSFDAWRIDDFTHVMELPAPPAAKEPK